MYAKIACPSCGKNLKVSEDLLGQRARCPHCKNQIQIPAPTEPAPGQQGVDWSQIVDTPTGSAEKTPASAKSVPVPRSGRFTGGTFVSPLWSGLIGLAAAVATVALLFPLRNTYIGAVILDRGWVPFVEVGLFSWAIVFMIMKLRRIRQQHDSMLFDLLPAEIAGEITPSNVGRFLDHVRAISADNPESILVNRVLRGLEHFRVRNSNSEVANMLASQSNIDANAALSSYSLVKVCNWAIPILGFIGTVIGIGNAVSGLGGDMAGADLDALKDKLGSITGGLGVAFDTTLVALVMSLFISFPASSLQKSEEDLLNEVDDYTNENLLLRLRDGSEQKNAAPTDPQQTLANALATQQAIVRMSEENLKQLVEQFTRAVGVLSEKTESAQRAIASANQQTTTSWKEQLHAIERGIGSLNGVLEKLGQERVVVEMHAPERRGWSFFRRSNGVGSRDQA